VTAAKNLLRDAILRLSETFASIFNLFPATFFKLNLILLSLKTQQRSSAFGTCFDVSNIIISHNEYILRFTE